MKINLIIFILLHFTSLACDTSDVEFEYELYRVDTDHGIVRSSSNRHVMNTVADVESEAMSLPPVLDDIFRQQQHFNEQKQQSEQNLNLHDLNLMLKSMILPPKQLSKQQQQGDTSEFASTDTICVNESGENKTTSAVANKNGQEENENDDDEDDDAKSQGMDKKTKYAQCLFASFLDFSIVATIYAHS